MKQNNMTGEHRYNVRWLLLFYDILIFALVESVMFFIYRGIGKLSVSDRCIHIVLFGICVFGSRFLLDIYRQIWRYGGIQSYIRLLLSDGIACLLYYVLQSFLPAPRPISAIQVIGIASINLLLGLAMRMLYRYAYKCTDTSTLLGRILHWLIRVFVGRDISYTNPTQNRIKIAIVGAGRVGTSLAEELLNSPTAAYTPKCFIDVSKEKIGRQIYGIPVLAEEDVSIQRLERLEIQEVVFALPQLSAEEKKRMYDFYRQSGCKIKVYDFPSIPTSSNSGKRRMREFDIEELLFRKPIEISDEKTGRYYRDKVILITGGGGSIGSELCRQIAKMKPKQLVILDVYENGAYDVQQELKIAYGDSLDLRVEILSVCNRGALERIFEKYRPNVVLNAAAHKHVPLMEHNCVEAVENNIFGTLNTVELSEKYGVDRFIMISTDKAVNPTNVMGATKRFCEMIVQAHSTVGGHTTFSATRFGNVLGSAGSVIPLFRRQINSGGPITLTDKRIIRYFMTIPEASQLVLQSGSMAKNGELFVLDMGQPVKILDLAENMIRLSGLEPGKDIEIIETGLRPGEKLYEELLVKSEELDKTENSLIFIERDTPAPLEEIEHKLELLRRAVETGSDEEVFRVLHRVVPTYRLPEEVNNTTNDLREMAEVKL
jgi:FlaA1/EpsC-like NDP-sugar epimerase